MTYPGRQLSVLAGVLILLYALPPDAVRGQEQSPALLETRVSRGRGVPVFPANTARYFRGRYDLTETSVDVYVIENDPSAGLPPPFVFGSDGEVPRDVWTTVVPCGSADLVYYSSRPDDTSTTMEVLLPSPGNTTDSGPSVLPYPYRLVLRVDSVPDTDTVCDFAAAFLELFEYFRQADFERGRALTFSGARLPEFPAVVELSQ